MYLNFPVVKEKDTKHMSIKITIAVEGNSPAHLDSPRLRAQVHRWPRVGLRN